MLVYPAPDLRGLSRRDLRVLGIVIEDWPESGSPRRWRSARRTVGECIYRDMVLLSAPSRTALTVRALRREGLFLPRRTTGA